MKRFSFFEDVPIPPRERPGVRLSFEDGLVSARFFLGEDDRVKPLSVKDPALLPLAKAVRPDGSVPVTAALRFLEQFEEGSLPSGAKVEIDSPVYLLSAIETPEDTVLDFLFDGEDALTPLAEAGGEAFSYDGNGVFLSPRGDFFSLPAARTVDPYLNEKRKLSSGQFGIFFKLLLPRLERETRVYSSLSLEKSSPVLFSPREGRDGSEIEAKWRVPYDELTFLPGNRSLCEFSGSLYPASRLFSSLPEALRRDGVLRPDALTLRILQNLYRELPGAFSAPPPSPLSAKPGQASPLRIPEREEIGVERRTFPGGEVTVTPVRPINFARASALSTFLRLHGDKSGGPLTPAPYNAFAPGWQDLVGGKLATYLYARSAFLRGETPEVDYSYLLLLIYEAVNRPDRLDFLFLIWKSGRERFRRLDTLMPALTRDYLTLYHPGLPYSLIRERVPFEPALLPHPEIYLSFEGEKAVSALPPSLFPRISGYEYQKSRYFTEDPARREEIPEVFSRALVAADRWFRDKEGKGLFARFSPPTLSFRVMACSPAPLLSGRSFELYYRYTAFLEGSGLKDFTGNLFKAAENILRERAGMRGRLRVELPEGFPAFLAEALAEKKKPVPLSLDVGRAVALEKDSWTNTDRLIAAAGTVPGEEPFPEPLVPEAPEASLSTPLSPGTAEPEEAFFPDAGEGGGNAFLSSLDEKETGFLALLLKGADEAAQNEFARARFTMPDLLIESINEKALDAAGDVLIENGGIIPEYRSLLEGFPEDAAEEREF